MLTFSLNFLKCSSVGHSSRYVKAKFSKFPTSMIKRQCTVGVMGVMGVFLLDDQCIISKVLLSLGGAMIVLFLLFSAGGMTGLEQCFSILAMLRWVDFNSQKLKSTFLKTVKVEKHWLRVKCMVKCYEAVIR